MTHSQQNRRRARAGAALIRFTGLVLAFSSLVKFAHPARPVAYMTFLGYPDARMFWIAALELLIAILFLRSATRPLGLLLVSSYFGGAIAAHLAVHPLNSAFAIVVFNFHHPLLGALPAAVTLAAAWLGVYLRHPALRFFTAVNGAVPLAPVQDAPDRAIENAA